MTNSELGYNGFHNDIHAPAQCSEWIKRVEGLKQGEESGAADWINGHEKAKEEKMKEMFPEMYS